MKLKKVNGYKRTSFAELYIFDLIERTQLDKKLLFCVNDIARITGHSYNRIFLVVRDLEKKGEIKKINNFNPEDKRKNYYLIERGYMDLNDYNYYGYDRYIKQQNQIYFN